METPFLDKAKDNGNRAIAARTKDEEDALAADDAVTAMEAGKYCRSCRWCDTQNGVEGKLAVKTVGDAWGIFIMESSKLWAIAVPIGFNVLYLYGPQLLHPDLRRTHRKPPALHRPPSVFPSSPTSPSASSSAWGVHWKRYADKPLMQAKSKCLVSTCRDPGSS